MGTRAILFDLDDTLLINPMNVFVPAYLRALTTFMAGRLDGELLTTSLLEAVRVMDRNTDWSRTNAEVFFASFLPPLGGDGTELRTLFDRFYAESYPDLQELTSPNPDAAAAVQWARGAGRQVVIATNPMFPETAILQRIEWAGFPDGGAAFDHVTTIENSHATKAHPEYYSEIARRLGRDPAECVMVGDNWQWDVVHSVASGMSAYWIAAVDEPRPEAELPVLGQGSLGDFVGFARKSLTG
jgi:FMN phosphatase YigB (HAD superfamily)